VFDLTVNVETQKLAIAAAGNILVAPVTDAKTCAILPSRETVADFVQAVQGEEHLRDVSVLAGEARKKSAFQPFKRVEGISPERWIMPQERLE
jgi:hypothetical protein